MCKRGNSRKLLLPPLLPLPPPCRGRSRGLLGHDLGAEDAEPGTLLRCPGRLPQHQQPVGLSHEHHVQPQILQLLRPFLLLVLPLRKERAEEPTASPDAPSSTGRPRVGRAAPEECRRLRSLLCGPGSATLPGRTLGGRPLSPWGCVVVTVGQDRGDGHLVVAKPLAEPSRTPPLGGFSVFSHRGCPHEGSNVRA